MKPRLAIAVFGLLCCLTATPGCRGRATPSEAVSTAEISEDAKAKSLSAKNALFQKLSGRLMSVMQSAGPAEAIAVCSKEATEIAATVSEEQGVTIGRTALKLRNKDNQPPQWAARLISEAATEPQYVDVGNGKVGALLPIKLQAKCLTCHGEEDMISDDVRDRLAKLYPDDRAIGFKEGDLRGWFWVEVPAI